VRRLLLVLHRWAGLTIALFVTVAGLTGALLAHLDTIEGWSAPAFAADRPAPAAGAMPLDPLVLRARAEALSGGHVDVVRFDQPPHKPAVFYVEGVEGYDELALDPWTGKPLGRRTWGVISEGWVNLMPFVYRLHYSLGFDGWGTWLFGAAALVWTVDCFFGAALTFPPSRTGRTSWWQRWGRAWTLRLPFRSAARRDMDLHRACGLWLWLILLFFAWSSVGFNFWQVYNPAMTAITGTADPREAQPSRAVPARPELSWAAARAIADKHIAAIEARGIRVARREVLIWDGAHAQWRMRIRMAGEPADSGHSDFAFHDADGSLAWSRLATGGESRWVIESWWFGLHVAGIGGTPGRWFVTLVGLAVATLSITGVAIWWRKRRARRKHRPAGPMIGPVPQRRAEMGVR
jgi:uncharacterized iron-regulated membrane protein